MKVFTVESTSGDERHWVAANTPEAAIERTIEEELEEEEDRATLVAKELTEEELDKNFINTPKEDLELDDDEEMEDVTNLDVTSEDSLEAHMNKYYDRVPMRTALNEAIAEGKESEVLASTIFME